jgi:hypothetical protein
LQAIDRCQLVLPPEGSDFQLLGSEAGQSSCLQDCHICLRCVS